MLIKLLRLLSCGEKMSLLCAEFLSSFAHIGFCCYSRGLPYPYLNPNTISMFLMTEAQNRVSITGNPNIWSRQ